MLSVVIFFQNALLAATPRILIRIAANFVSIDIFHTLSIGL
jgi:hypothetical protein